MTTGSFADALSFVHIPLSFMLFVIICLVKNQPRNKGTTNIRYSCFLESSSVYFLFCLPA